MSFLENFSKCWEHSFERFSGQSTTLIRNSTIGILEIRESRRVGFYERLSERTFHRPDLSQMVSETEMVTVTHT